MMIYIMSVHFASLKGNRSSNEDKHTIELGLTDPKDDKARVNMYGIYDGHGGKFVSKFLSEHLPKFFLDQQVKYPLSVAYIDEVYGGLQQLLHTKHCDQATECGSTCLVVCHFVVDDQSYLNVINVGDSRCVMCRNGIAHPLTKDHKPNWPEERARISLLGGQIHFDGHDWRINDLSVSRAFGDKASEKYVTSKPDVFKYKLAKKDKFIIMACDGLWDVCSPQDAVNFVLDNCYDVNMKRINKNVNIARKLAEHALNNSSSDNITIIIVFFDHNN